jgi:tRNA nucleotidyltransferase/poly(A) polymerase
LLGISYQSLAHAIKYSGISRKFAECPFKGRVFLVGGALREFALGCGPRDWDLALSDPGDLTVIEELFQRHSFLLGKKPIQTHRIAAGDTMLDITILESSIEKDLERRDFTMNAIAFDMKAQTVIDPLDGLHDIDRRLIRYPNRATITSDPLRMLKAIRHLAALDGFMLDPELKEAISSLGNLIGTTAPERVKYELDLVMISYGAHRGIEMLDETGLVFEIFPELMALREMDIEKSFLLETYGHTMFGFRYLHSRGREYVADPVALKDVGYALLFHDLGKAHTYSYDEKKELVHFFNHERISRDIATGIMDRLRFSTHETKRICSLIEHHMRIFLISSSDATEKAIRRLIYRMEDLTPLLIAHTLCDMYGSSGGEDNPSTCQVIQNCSAIMSAWRESRREPLSRLISGNDLKKLGFSEGRFLGECLDTVRDRQIAGEISTRDEALALAEQMLRDRKA